MDFSLQASRHDTFTGVGNDILVYNRNRMVRTYREHSAPVTGLLLIGPLLVSYDQNNAVKLIDVSKRSIIGGLDILQPASISCAMHPATYLNKILFGYSNGVFELWNIRSRRLVFTFRLLPAGAAAAVVCIEQSPACDVVAVGYSNGLIQLVNLKLDKVLFTFKQEGPVTSLSFRTDASAYTGASPYLASSSAAGELHIWRLGGDVRESIMSQRGLVCTVQDAHSGPISKVHFFEGEPILVTSSADNSIKVWIFDQPEGQGPRLLRSREGHIAPPQLIRYYGTGGYGSSDASLRDAADGYSCEIVSCGSGGDIRLINTGRESQNRQMSQKAILKKLGYDRRRALLPPAIGVDFSETREKDWGNMVSIHKNHSNAYTWKYRNRVVTELILRQPSWKSNDLMYPEDPANYASAVTVSACGNFCVIGNKGGSIHRYNLQSGRPRGSYPSSSSAMGMKPSVHSKRLATPGNVLNAQRSILGVTDETNVTGYLSFSLKKKQDKVSGKSSATVFVKKTDTNEGHLGSSITGLFIDAMNEVMVSAGDDANGLIQFWDFENRIVLGHINAESPVKMIAGYRDGGFVAAICEDSCVKVFDVSTRRLSRVFAKGHTAPITGASFTPDGRRFMTSSMDGTVRTWDMLTARCLSWVSIGVPITSMALSPSGEFMAVTLDGKQGIYLYADRSLFETVHFWREPTAPSPVNVSVSCVDTALSHANDVNVSESENSDEENNAALAVTPDEDIPDASKKEDSAQRGDASITMSGIPRAYWTTLFNLDAVKARNRPIAPPVAPEKAPFFLPTIHRDGSVAPVFPSAGEYHGTEETIPNKNGDSLSNAKKRKRGAVEEESDPTVVAAAIASMGSAWTDDVDFGDDADEGVAVESSDDDAEVEKVVEVSYHRPSRILKKKDMPREVAISARFEVISVSISLASLTFL